jgi:hypothetical protein
MKRWSIAICTGCGGVFGGIGEPACSCDPAQTKTGKKVEVIPAEAPNVLSFEEIRLLREFAAVDSLPAQPLSDAEREARLIADRLADFAGDEGEEGRQ